MLTLVDDPRVQFDSDRAADDVAEEAGRVLALALGDAAVLHDVRGPAAEAV